MSTDIHQEAWQVESNGQVFDTTFSEMTRWIEEGSIERSDKVRKGNLRWIEAGKVPSLHAVFNAKENGQPAARAVVTTTKLEQDVFRPAAVTALPQIDEPSAPQPPAEDVCTAHPDLPAAYVCDTCQSQFCKACPSSYGGTVKICPMCGAMCSPKTAVVATASVTRKRTWQGGRLGLSDLVNALGHPFKFKASLIIGALMFATVSLGESAADFGGIVMFSSAIFCFLLANMFTFGILANTAEKFAQGETDSNFMPSFEDFNAWDDILKPFFLSVSVNLVSFGPMIVVAIVLAFTIAGSLAGDRSSAASAVAPDMTYAGNAIKQSSDVRSVLADRASAERQRIAEMQEMGVTGQSQPAPQQPAADDKEIERLQKMIADQKKAELESTFGKDSRTHSMELGNMVAGVIRAGGIFLVLLGICVLWGIAYYPAACVVAGYTQSVGAVLNPSVGIDTIKRLGSDYWKLLAIGIVLTIAAGTVSSFFAGIMAPLDLPGLGNLPAKFVASIFGFYFWAVFCCVIGYMLYKAADRLELPS